MHLNSLVRWMTIGSMLALCVAAAPESQKSPDEQFIAVGMARTQADLAVRKLRQFTDIADNQWRADANAVEIAHNKAVDELRKAADDEAKKPDEIRDPGVMDALAQQRAAVDQQWQQYSNVDRPNLEASFRAAEQMAPNLQQIFSTISGIDGQWKDAKLDLKLLQADYDAIADRARAAHAAEQADLQTLQNDRQTWIKLGEAATRPAH